MKLDRAYERIRIFGLEHEHNYREKLGMTSEFYEYSEALHFKNFADGKYFQPEIQSSKSKKRIGGKRVNKCYPGFRANPQTLVCEPERDKSAPEPRTPKFKPETSIKKPPSETPEASPITDSTKTQISEREITDWNLVKSAEDRKKLAERILNLEGDAQLLEALRVTPSEAAARRFIEARQREANSPNQLSVKIKNDFAYQNKNLRWYALDNGDDIAPQHKKLINNFWGDAESFPEDIYFLTKDRFVVDKLDGGLVYRGVMDSDGKPKYRDEQGVLRSDKEYNACLVNFGGKQTQNFATEDEIKELRQQVDESSERLERISSGLSGSCKTLVSQQQKENEEKIYGATKLVSDLMKNFDIEKARDLSFNAREKILKQYINSVYESEDPQTKKYISRIEEFLKTTKSQSVKAYILHRAREVLKQNRPEQFELELKSIDKKKELNARDVFSGEDPIKVRKDDRGYNITNKDYEKVSKSFQEVSFQGVPFIFEVDGRYIAHTVNKSINAYTFKYIDSDILSQPDFNNIPIIRYNDGKTPTEVTSKIIEAKLKSNPKTKTELSKSIEEKIQDFKTSSNNEIKGAKKNKLYESLENSNNEVIKSYLSEREAQMSIIASGFNLNGAKEINDYIDLLKQNEIRVELKTTDYGVTANKIYLKGISDKFRKKLRDEETRLQLRPQTDEVKTQLENIQNLLYSSSDLLRRNEYSGQMSTNIDSLFVNVVNSIKDVKDPEERKQLFEKIKPYISKPIKSEVSKLTDIKIKGEILSGEEAKLVLGDMSGGSFLSIREDSTKNNLNKCLTKTACFDDLKTYSERKGFNSVVKSIEDIEDYSLEDNANWEELSKKWAKLLIDLEGSGLQNAIPNLAEIINMQWSILDRSQDNIYVPSDTNYPMMDVFALKKENGEYIRERYSTKFLGGFPADSIALAKVNNINDPSQNHIMKRLDRLPVETSVLGDEDKKVISIFPNENDPKAIKKWEKSTGMNWSNLDNNSKSKRLKEKMSSLLQTYNNNPKEFVNKYGLSKIPTPLLMQAVYAIATVSDLNEPNSRNKDYQVNMSIVGENLRISTTEIIPENISFTYRRASSGRNGGLQYKFVNRNRKN